MLLPLLNAQFFVFRLASFLSKDILRTKSNGRILLKGGCELGRISAYGVEQYISVTQCLGSSYREAIKLRQQWPLKCVVLAYSNFFPVKGLYYFLKNWFWRFFTPQSGCNWGTLQIYSSKKSNNLYISLLSWVGLLFSQLIFLSNINFSVLWSTEDLDHLVLAASGGSPWICFSFSNSAANGLVDWAWISVFHSSNQGYFPPEWKCIMNHPSRWLRSS